MRTLIILFLLLGQYVSAQRPPLYIHIVSHNEPTDSLQHPARYARAKANALTMADIIDAKNARWNLQTSDGFVFGARQDEYSTGSNVFEQLAASPYADNVEIDPRSKNFPGRNIADQWYLLDSLGANPSYTVGGFIYYVCPPGNQNLIDWWQYTDTVTGFHYGNKIKFDILSGAGSLSAHCNDLNDFGIFKPDTTTNFYQHNPSRNLWCVGTGCAPLLDSLTDEQSIIDQIRREVDSIQQGWWPSDRFYVTRIMTNQREFGPLLFQKITRILDSLNTLPSGQLQWATIGETVSAFNAWRQTSGRDYSQWQCGEAITGLEEPTRFSALRVFPNPTTGSIQVLTGDAKRHWLIIHSPDGREHFSGSFTDSDWIDLRFLSPGMYHLRFDNEAGKILIKN